MPTRYNPRLLVRLNGTLVATADPVGARADLLAVDKASVSWGRSRVWDHQQSASASLSLIDRLFTYGVQNGPSLLNVPLTLGYDVPGVLTERTFFRGAVAEYTATVLPPDPKTGANRGMRIDVSANSVMSNAANAKTGVVSYPAGEFFGIRWGKLENFLVPALLADTVYWTDAAKSWWNRPLVARTYNNENALDAQRQLLDMTGDRQVYDPHTNVASFSHRRRIDDTRGYAVPVSEAGAGGLVLKVPGTESAPTLDASEFTGGKLTKNTEGRITSIAVTQYADSSGATQVSGGKVYTDTVGETTAPTPMTVATDWYQSADSAATLDEWLGVMSREAKYWRPEPITHQTQRVGGIPLAWIPYLLNGAELPGAVYFARSDWARAQLVPAFYVIGGTIDYRGGDPGWWAPSVQLAPVAYYDASAGIANARTPANCDVGAVHPIKVADLSPLMSAADSRFWTTPFLG